jgi:phospholipase C
MSVNRREFLRNVAGAASAAALAGAVAGTTKTSEAQELPSPSASQIDHIVVVMMENRSFDHLLGWLPGANGRQAGLSYLDSDGVAHPTSQLTTYVGCAHPDPDHSYTGGRSEYDDGKMDGWLRTTTNDVFSIGYYVEGQLPFFSALARNFTTLDNYFASILGPTFPNRVFQHAAQTDRISNTLDISTLPTIWDTPRCGRCDQQVLLLERPISGFVGAKVHWHLSSFCAVSRRCGCGNAARGFVCRSALYDSRRWRRKRRSSPCRSACG